MFAKLSCGLVALCVACSPPTPPQEPAPPPPFTAPLPTSGANAPSTTPPSTGTNTANEKLCGGIAGVQCPAKQYCSYPPEAHCGAADMSGTCASVPDVCAEVVDEVCGCDDKTYPNACKAAQAGVSMVMKGACAKHEAAALAEGALCGTRGVSADCGDGLYCAYKADCGATDAGGKCSKKPMMCTKIYAPVCGCDGKTYGSDCTAASAGVSVMRKGECKR